jgi:hypothetical protein
MRGWAGAMALAVLLVCAVGAAMLQLRTDQPGVVTWRDAPRLATVLLLRRTISPATVYVRIGAGSAEPQRIDAALNGRSLGAVDVAAGVDYVILAVPGSYWQIGANTLELSPTAIDTVRDVTVRPTRSSSLARP